jgi:hypothetical protein
MGRNVRQMIKSLARVRNSREQLYPTIIQLLRGFEFQQRETIKNSTIRQINPTDLDTSTHNLIQKSQESHKNIEIKQVFTFFATS